MTFCVIITDLAEDAGTLLSQRAAPRRRAFTSPPGRMTRHVVRKAPRLLGILRCVHVLCMPESGDREGNKQEDCINLWSAGEGEGTRGARLVEGTPHNQAPVSAVSRRLIQLVSIPASAPQASTKGAHIVLFKTHARGTDSI